MGFALGDTGIRQNTTGSWDPIRLARDVVVLDTEVLGSAETDRSNASFAQDRTKGMNTCVGPGTQDCAAKPGVACQHMPAKCGNCEGKHPATAEGCPKKRQARKQVARGREDPQLSQGVETMDTPETEVPQASQTPELMNSSQALSECQDECLTDAPARACSETDVEEQ